MPIRPIGLGGYPFDGIGEVKEYVRVVLTTEPVNIGKIFLSEGPPLYSEPYAYCCYEFQRNGVTSYSCWFGLNTSPVVVPITDISPQVDVSVIVAPIPGAVVSETVVPL